MPQSNEEESNQSGNLPERVISENTESDSGADLENQGVRNRKTTKLGDSDSDKDMEGHHCNVCKIWVKKKTAHCDDCNVCIEGFDHHCMFYSKCIGAGNIFYFYAVMGLVVLNNINILIFVGITSGSS